MNSNDILYMEERLEHEASRFFRCMTGHDLPPDSWGVTQSLLLEVVKLFEREISDESRLLFHTWRGTYNIRLIAAQANKRGGRLIDLFAVLYSRYKELKDGQSKDRSVDTGTATRQDGAVQQRLHGNDMG